MYAIINLFYESKTHNSPFTAQPSHIFHNHFRQILTFPEVCKGIQQKISVKNNLILSFRHLSQK